jgi:hypothetical protein
MTPERQRTNPPRLNFMNQYSHTPGATQTPAGTNGQHLTLQLQPQPQQLDPLQQECLRLQRENSQLVRRNRELEVVVELTGLFQEGVEFDPREEIPALVELDDNQRALYYQRMRVRYRRRDKNQGQGQPVQYDRYGRVVQTGPAPVQLPQPQLPGVAPAPGQQVVPQQYQRSEQPGGVVQPEPLSGEERNQVYDEMRRQIEAGEPEDFGAAVQVVRYGRQRQAQQRGRVVPGQEQVY